MYIALSVSLISGKSESIRVAPDSFIEELKKTAQDALGVRGRLFTASGRRLEDGLTVAEAGLHPEDALTLCRQQISVVGHGAQAALLGDGSVVTWGDKFAGADSSSVQEQLKGVQHIQASMNAFAAILSSGSVVTWGKPHYGGSSSAVQDRLKGVQHIQATPTAFAAILNDGSVVTWGNQCHGGDSTEVQEQLRGVEHIQASSRAFAAIRSDGCVVTWGASDSGGDTGFLLKNLNEVAITRTPYCLLYVCLGVIHVKFLNGSPG